jgi:branched-chain amino acid transport system permease protein
VIAAVDAGLLFQLLLQGISLGAVFALLGLGIVLIYKSSGVMNFAHGSMAMFSTYIYFELMRSTPLGVAGAAIVSVVVGAALGAAVYLLVFRRMQGSGLLAKVIASLAVAGLLQGIAGYVWRDAAQAKVALAVEGSVRLPGGSLSWQEILTIFVTLAAGVALIALLRRSTFGIRLRATAQNRMAARMLGVRDNRVAATSWAIGGGLAALAGVLVIPLGALTTISMSGFMVRGFVAAAVGGLVSLPAALIGGFSLGVLQDVIIGTPLASVSRLLAGVGIAVLLLLRVERFFALEQEIRALEETG